MSAPRSNAAGGRTSGAADNVRFGCQDGSQNATRHARKQSINPRREDLDALIAHGPEHYRGIFKAVRDHRLALLNLWPGQRLGRDVIPGDRPVLLIIGEDAQPDTAPGPRGYSAKALSRALGPASGVFIHAGAAHPPIYAAATGAAIMSGHAALIETQEHRVSEWLSAIGRHAPEAAQTVAAPDAVRSYGPGGGA